MSIKPRDLTERPSSTTTPGYVAPRSLKWIAITGAGLVTTFVMAASWSPIGRYFGLETLTVDYSAHVQNAEEITTTGITFPHFLWHVLVVAVHSAAPGLSWAQAAHYVVVASYGLQGALLAWVLTSTGMAERLERRRMLSVVALALLLVIAGPVTILTWREQTLYFGYLNMDSYANPTHALLKPLALIVFVLTVRGFEHHRGVRHTIVLGAAVVLSSLAKPTLLICLLPAVLVLGGLRWFYRREVDVRYLLVGFIVPSAGVLAWQYLAHFGSEGQSSIIFAPFHVMGFYAAGLAPKFLLSILLPLTVLISYPRHSLTAAAMQLAWLQVGLAAGYSYLLAETNKTMDGNFVWSGQIGNYLLYVYATVIALSRWTNEWRSWLCALAFSLHTISGVLFFVYPSHWGTPLRHEARNAALVHEVKRALASDAIVGHIPIQVESDGAIVRLTGGQTNAAERARAVEIASTVDGVRYVEQNMK